MDHQLMPVRASVIVVSYNSVDDLPACLDSIIADLGQQDEVIVVDNGSSDASVDLLRQQYPQVRLVASTNTGYAGGNNVGARVARGEFLVLLNPDTVLLPGALDALIMPLQKRSDLGLTTACVVHMDQPEIVNTCGNTMHYTGLTYCRGAGQQREQFAHDAEVNAVSGAACALRKSVFEALGGFDERFFMYVEDTDLSWRARLAGFRCWYVADAVVKHAYRPAYSPSKAMHLDRNRHVMLLKNLSGRMYLRLLPGLILSEIVTWGFLLIHGPRFWGVKIQVYRWLWQQRRAIIASRRATQRLRQRPDHAIIGDMTYRLEFGQLASRWLAALAGRVFHPAFWAAQRLVVTS